MEQSNQQEKWREQKRSYRQRNRTVSLSFPKQEAEKLENSAREMELSLPDYLKKVIRAKERGNGYVLPEKSLLKGLIEKLHSSANNINQIVRYIHLDHELDYSDIQRLQRQLLKMEEQIEASLTLPPSIEQVLEKELNKHPEKANRLIQFIENRSDKQT